MAKNKKNKSNKKLRREVEILRAQVKTTEKLSPTISHTNSVTKVNKSKKETLKLQSDDAFIKKDLLKTAVISTFEFSVIIVLWFIN